MTMSRLAADVDASQPPNKFNDDLMVDTKTHAFNKGIIVF